MAKITWGSGHIVIALDWTEFTTIVEAKGIEPAVQYVEPTDQYVVFCVDGPIVYNVTIYKDNLPLDCDPEANAAAKEDFEDNWKANCNKPLQPREETGAEALALQKKGLSGLPVVSTAQIPIEASNFRKSWEVTSEPETTTNMDIHVADDLVGPQGNCFLSGGLYVCRTSATKGSAIHFAVVDRDDTLGYFIYYGLSRTKMELSNVSGSIEVGQTVTGGTSGQTAKVLKVVDADTIEITFANGSFTDTEAVSFTGGATAICDDWVEGDVLELRRSVKDEWLEGYEEQEIRPGDSQQLIAGLYFRIILYNADNTNDLRVKVTLDVGVE